MKLQLAIDRFEEGKAVLIIGDELDTVVWPRDLLPRAAQEGDILTVTISVDSAATAAAKRKVETVLEQLLAKKNK